MSTGKGNKQSCRLRRCASAPLRALRVARDWYVQSLTSCAGDIRSGGQFGTTASAMSSSLPRSFSVASSSNRSSATSDEDLRELMRIASRRVLHDSRSSNSPIMDVVTRRGEGILMPRSVSHSVTIARIDEDKPFDLAQQDDHSNSTTKSSSYPRSRSSAAASNKSYHFRV